MEEILLKEIIQQCTVLTGTTRSICSLQPQLAMVPYMRRLLFFLQEEEQTHSEAKEFSSKEKSRRDREGKFFQEEPNPLPTQKEANKLLGSLHRDVGVSKSGEHLDV